MIEKIKHLAEKFTSDIISFRRHLHSYPELSFEEYNTSKFINQCLEEMNVLHKSNIVGTGIIGTIEGKNPRKRVVALRADIDALPIHETNNVEYKSKNEGVMHACGHDVHTSSLLGALKIINNLKDEFEGTVKFIFQPGEEKLPGGASLMIRDGALQNPYPNSIFGQHVMPSIPAGKIGFRKGMYMASSDELHVTVRGKGGHAAMPDKLIDPILIASHIIIALQQIISRNRDPKMPAVLSFGKVIANGATNVVPDEVFLQGTFRTFDEAWRKESHVRIKKMAESIAEGMGGSCEFKINSGYPFLKNEPLLTQRARDSAEEYVGSENIIDLDLYMAAEDFSFYSQETDACFYRLGTGNDVKGITSGVHTSTFDIDESALTVGAGLMAYIALKELQA